MPRNLSRIAARFIGVVCFGVAIAGTATAGVYDPKEPGTPLIEGGAVRSLPFEPFRRQLDELRSIAIAGPDPKKQPPLRTEFLRRRDDLRQKDPDGLAELGFVLLRLRESDRALEALKQAESRDRRNFWVMSHLAIAYLQSGQLADAARYQMAALDSFPTNWPGGEAQRKWFRQSERALLKLMQLRMQEQRGQPAGRVRPVENVDALFGDIRWVGPNGEYEAGTLADAEKAKLPADDIATVQQLLLWLPDDTRLYWLLGELYNATGELDAAERIFDECVDSRRFDAALLRGHRKAVKEAIAARPAPPPAANWMPSAESLWVAGAIVVVCLGGLIYLQIREVKRRLRSADRPPRMGQKVESERTGRGQEPKA